MNDVSAAFRARRKGMLPDTLDMDFDFPEAGRTTGSFTAERKHMAPNGFMHAGSVVTLMDSACAFGCVTHLPEGASGFTTVELKSNFLGSAAEGQTVSCEARLVHAGRTTQVWDAEARRDGRVIALFRCTQMILYAKA